MLSNTDKAETSKISLLTFRACSRFQHRELPHPPQVSYPRSTYHYYPTIAEDNERQKETFMLTSTTFYRLCPMLNGTWKPEDRPDGQGDSSFGAVPAALTL
jgi:hypothetical protein